jgi:hypothetical protein
MSKVADVKIDWDDIDWHNTHTEATLGIYHLGICDHELGQCVALSVALDDDEDSPEPQIILLNEDAIDELMKYLRQTAKSL